MRCTDSERSWGDSQVAAIPFLWPTFLQNPANRLPYYEEAGFLVDEKDHAANQEASAPHQRPERCSRAQILAEVHRAVLSVLGDGVSDSTPLMHAGLDSLGISSFVFSHNPMNNSELLSSTISMILAV